ncbi:MFS general substrate transporter, partial [Mycena leptocephala]
MDSKISPKESVHIVEEKGSVEPEQNLYNAHIDIAEIDQSKLIRKIDLRLIPWFSLLYLLSFLDRTSIGNAKLYNLEGDLKISDNQYLISLTVFFIRPVVRFSVKVPSNIFLKRLRPSVWFAFLMVMWGLIMTLQGVAHNFGGLVGKTEMDARVFEAGLYPGTSFEEQKEVAKSSQRHGIPSQLAAISNMDGIGGRPAWAWIFILEGLATILAGIASYWIVQDFPDTAKFLTETERTFVIRRLQGDDQYSAAGEKLQWKNILASFRDWKTWLSVRVYMRRLLNLKLIPFLNQLGFRATPANLLTVPIYAFAAIVTCCVALYADKHGRRGYCNIVMLSLGGVGYIILIVSRNAALSYFAVFVATCGIFPVVPNTVTWIANNFEGTYKRGVSLAMAISMGNLNGAVSSNVYRARDRPWYPLGSCLVLMYICIGILVNSATLYLLKRENARRDRGERDEVIGRRGWRIMGTGGMRRWRMRNGKRAIIGAGIGISCECFFGSTSLCCSSKV